jgi:hypothetical protein
MIKSSAHKKTVGDSGRLQMQNPGMAASIQKIPTLPSWEAATVVFGMVIKRISIKQRN